MPASISARACRLLAATLVAATLAACSQEPPPAPTPVPGPTAAPAPVAPPPTPSFADWMVAPRTPGDWRYGANAASFGTPGAQPLFTMRCDRGTGSITLARPAGGSGSPIPLGGQAGTGQAPMRILTETQTRMLSAIRTADGIAVRLPARDRLLDAMAFSKGRFAVETGGLPTLYLPSWAEVSRVIEDCRG